jgi:phosphomannomutase
MSQKKLMVSTSGIRGVVGSGLDPIMIARYAAAFGSYLKKGKVVVGRDSRPSGEIYKMAAISGLSSVGLDVIDIGIVPTPTVEIAVSELKAAGGICLTASHNPSEWNALKFFGKDGEFIDKKTLESVKKIYDADKMAYVGYRRLGKISYDGTWIDKHIRRILAQKIIDVSKTRKAGIKVVVDAVNGAGSEALPLLLERLGARVVRLNCAGDGNFVHKPEPIPENLRGLCRAVVKHKADLGMACDPDADRLALVDEKGKAIGEELTLALAAKHVLSRKRGNVVVNLSTSLITESVASSYNCRTYYTPVGEANVISGIRKYRAVVGGEGNGGVIYPAFHRGRDALIAAAIVLSLLAGEKKSLSEMTGTLPIYHYIKLKAPLPDGFEAKLAKLEKAAADSFDNLRIDRQDGLRFNFSRGWFQIRKSNTEPIFRTIIETDSKKLTETIKIELLNLLK